MNQFFLLISKKFVYLISFLQIIDCSTSASCYDCLIPLQPQCHFDLFTQTCYFQCANCSSTTTCPMFTSINPPSSMNSGNPVLYVNATYFVNSTLPYACQFGVGPTVVSIFATLLSSTSLQCSAPPYSSVLTGNPAPYTGNVPFVVTLGGSPYFPVTSYYYYGISIFFFVCFFNYFFFFFEKRLSLSSHLLELPSIFQFKYSLSMVY